MADQKDQARQVLGELLARWCVPDDIPFHAIESLWLQEHATPPPRWQVAKRANNEKQVRYPLRAPPTAIRKLFLMFFVQLRIAPQNPKTPC